jgi:16S rRNA processing protein RimM
MRKVMHVKYIEIGKIVGTHGIKGELKIISDSDFRSVRFQKGNTIFLSFEKSMLAVQITSSRTHKQYDLITINGLFDINDVEQYIGCGVFIDKENLDQLDEGEYYFDDLIGKKVQTADGEIVGIVKDILDLPQGEILVVTKPNQKEIMIPFVDEFIQSVTDDVIVITPIEGLIE